MALTYEQFIEKVGDENQFIKFINKEKKHFGFSYKIGLNQDILQFDPSGSCKKGGLYFTSYKNADIWIHCGINLAPVILCKDALFYIEPCGTKYKTNKFQIEEIIDLDLMENKQPNLNICRIAVIKKWKVFSKLNYYLFINNNNMMMSDEIRMYNLAIVQKNGEILNSIDKLYKNDFTFNMNYVDAIPLYNYIAYKDNMCIAGGHLALQYFNKKIEDYPDSDINVFILKTNNYNDNDNDNDNDYKITIRKFLKFLNNTYIISYIEGDSTSKCSIFNVICKNFERNIQIICTNYLNIAMLMNSFDSSYCKCCLYMTDTYVTPDAKITKDTGYTCFYSYNPFLKRIKKALRLGINVLNSSARIQKAIELMNEKYKNKEKQYRLSIHLATDIVTPIVDWGEI
jgi:hypothetical protein